MAVADRWHKSRPRPGEEKCKCRPAKVPTAEHGQGKRWQVRWRDDAGEPQKLNFEKLPDAQSKDAQIKASLDRGDYLDPKAGQVTLAAYAKQWRDGLTSDQGTLTQIDSRLSKWVFGKSISAHTMGMLAKRPSLVQAWVKEMEGAGLQPSTIKLIVGTVSAVFNAAIDDQIIGRNPCATKSVRPPARAPKKVVPWTLGQVEAMGEALPSPYRAMAYLGAGCAHRQGELFGVALGDVDFLGRAVQVLRQVRIIDGQLVFAPPKRGKTRTVPLPESVALRLSAHIAAYPPVEVTLPWKVPDGEPVTAALLFTGPRGGALHRNTFNYTWRLGLEVAGIVPAPVAGERRKPYREHGCHALRHTAASAWLGAGVDIRTVAEYLGHSDPGFTLRTYTHLMPDAADRARKAMDAFFAEGTADVSSALVVPSG
ncbi:tyrosine-type recombinase/integrase [Streptosporangium sp. NBC_01810]|uniref:tyrosine-type recombinase/integrase n=1 Tax=Streptosporangium sp. NBC_01810 TaxID=2975951 RepID=UPI002DD851F2|nr:site-specific integrase [Streptosporangium sp. NBC_01810]WSA29420.1 tyrosine-type recombinase/integrase [Streptosporangium sp. NBC_01810]